jgi:hypothetical protein
MKKIILVLIVLFSFEMNSQISGVFTVPGSFPTIAAAINTLNLTGVAGPVTINVAAGYTETVPVGGLKLINPLGSTTTTILFQKQGAGSNPLLSAYSGGTATANSAKKDGIWMFVDCKNITVDGIDLIDPNTSAPACMEFGYGFYKFSSGNCFNTIRNCSITLSGLITGYSFGIDMTSNSYLTNTMSVAPSSTAATNSYNGFYNNTIQKCDIAISITGYNLNAFKDTGNDVGGSSGATGNKIINYGTGSTASGISANYQTQFNSSYNTINNNTGTGVTAIDVIQGIYTSGNGSTINSNTITLKSSGNFASMQGIIEVGTLSSSTSTISNNLFSAFSHTPNLSPTTHSVIACSGNTASYLTGNQITNFSAGNGTVNLISVSGGNTANINSNSITSVSLSPQSIINGITCSAGQQQINNNYIANLTASNTSTTTSSGVNCINSPYGGGLTATNNTIIAIRGNVLNGISMTSTVAASTYSIAYNTINDFAMAPTNTIGCSPTGIFAVLTNTTAGSMTIRNNTVYNFVAKGQTRGIVGAKGANDYIFQNKVYDLSTTSAYVYGMDISGGQNFIYNNLVGGLQSTSSGNITTLVLDQANTSRVYFNSLYLNTSSTNPSGTNLISSINNTIIELRNNVLVNTCTGPSGPAILIANNVLSTSNNNCFYYGPSGRIFRTAPTTTALTAYQALFSSDAKSFVENPPFVSITGSNPNFLNISATIPTQIESGAASISTITTDFIGAVRSSTPDVGAWEGNYIAADVAAPFVVSYGFTGPPCNTSARTFTANLTDSSAVAAGSLSPRLYYRVNFGLYTSTQGTLTSGTTKNGVWTFNLGYSAVLNDVIWYFLVAQDTSYLKNIQVMPSTGSSVTDVNTVNIPPNPAYNYTIQTSPTISVAITNTTICSGTSFVITPSGASSYSYSPGGSATVSPTVNSTYNVSGTSSLGCPSTNSIAVTVSVMPSPTVTVNSGTICTGQSFTLVPSGATSYTFQGGSATVSPTTTTNYIVTGSDPNGCIAAAIANVFVSTCTNIQELNKELLKVWPNPTNGNLNIDQGTEIKELHIRIMDATGRTIFETITISSSISIDLYHCSNGIYFMDVCKDGGTISRSKFIISRH